MKLKSMFIALAIPFSCGLSYGQLDPIHQSLEAMKETQGGLGMFLGQNYGPDSTSTLHFDVQMDNAGNGYAFHSQQGQSFLGMSLEATFTGTRGSNPDQFTWAGQMSLNGNLVNGSGSGEFGSNFGDFNTEAPNSFTFEETWYLAGSTDQYRRSGIVTWGKVGDVWMSGGTQVFTKNGVVTGRGSGTDKWDPKTGEWIWGTINNSAEVAWNQNSSGSLSGFSTKIEPVPEPASFGIFIISFGILLVKRQRCKVG